MVPQNRQKHPKKNEVVDNVKTCLEVEDNFKIYSI